MPDDKTVAVTETTKVAITPAVDATSATDLADRLVQRYGSEKAALTVLADENFIYRNRHRDDQKELSDIRGLTVTKEEKELLGKYVALGTPVDLEKIKKDYPELQTKLKDADERVLFDTVGKLAGYNSKVLADQARSKKIVFEIVKEKVDGQDAEVPYAKFEGQDDSRLKVSEFAEKNLSEYIPSLTMTDDSHQNRQEPNVTKVPRQIGNRGKVPNQTNPATAYIEAAYETPAQRKAAKSNAS